MEVNLRKLITSCHQVKHVIKFRYEKLYLSDLVDGMTIDTHLKESSFLRVSKAQPTQGLMLSLLKSLCRSPSLVYSLVYLVQALEDS